MKQFGDDRARADSYRYLYGPVPSRRLGRSLGVDIVPHKVCSYDCLYCQLGRTTCLTTAPEPLVSPAQVMPEIERWLEADGVANCLTFAGSGEPALNSGLGEMIAATKALCSLPVAAITNGSLLSRPEVREAVAGSDLLVASLDAGAARTFRVVNRPAPGIEFDTMCEGLRQTVQECAGQVWLEIMLVEKINDSEGELRALAEAVRQIRPHRVQINTVERPSRSGRVHAVPPETLALAAGVLEGAELVTSNDPGSAPAPQWQEIEQELAGILCRRPCTLGDLMAVSGRNPQELIKHLHRLIARGVLEQVGDVDPSYRTTLGGFHG